jgi:hypothetical protein
VLKWTTAGAVFLALFPICRDTKQIYSFAGVALRLDVVDEKKRKIIVERDDKIQANLIVMLRII